MKATYTQFSLFTLILTSLLLLSACGQSGPLYLPEQRPKPTNAPEQTPQPAQDTAPSEDDDTKQES
ncbi:MULTISPECIES: lipoprotein [unclassified Pseudoalteromonas]|uniref:LPS translocon maturation chaperone LptM n=1 Tax=unclassified Pseudoalteromonas TaxID=194690 RepID=UPI002096C5BF|nr:lipoprotein [Pseudoalteromonas sp. XMcav2-N]MCO7190979.1 lipoprotein [Pseudoalteromonas sp. XMcav2-N]